MFVKTLTVMRCGYQQAENKVPSKVHIDGDHKVFGSLASSGENIFRLSNDNADATYISKAPKKA